MSELNDIEAKSENRETAAVLNIANLRDRLLLANDGLVATQRDSLLLA